MKRPDEYARLLMEKALGDFQVIRLGSTDTRLADWIVGFHAQQAVEKALKAVLSREEIAYPHTHSIKKLLQLLKDSELPPPPDGAGLELLSQFAGEIRYGARHRLEPAETIDRTWALQCVERTIAWAETALQQGR